MQDSESRTSRWRRWFSGRNKSAVGARRHPSADTDTPIQTESEDRLRRVAFARRIAEVLSEKSQTEGRVFAIRGSWGHGKTSLMNLVIRQLERRPDDAQWLEFNPWQWGDADSIARALFKQIADKLGGRYSSKAAKRAKAFRRYGAILTGAAEPLKAAKISTQTIATVLTGGAVVALASSIGFSLPSAAVVAGLMACLGIITPLVGKMLTALGRDRWSEPLDQIRRSLEQSLQALDKPLIIFVDDIDRLEPDQIRLLFRQVKVNANLPNIIFVMLFQPSIVEAALNPIAYDQGRQFLEKIVQANFDLPAVPQSLVHSVFTEELSLIASAYATEENGFDEVRWGNVLIGCIQPYVRNLRDARRLLSSIAIHLPLHDGGPAFEVNIIDLLALEALRVFEPSFHAALFENRDLVLRTASMGSDGLDKIYRDRATKLVESVPEERREIAKTVILELFPSIAWALGGTHYGGDFVARWVNSKRVCTERFFPRYFELQTPEGEITESEFVALLSVSDDQEALMERIADIEQRRMLPSLAARFDESVERLPVENASVLLPAMFRIGQSLVSVRSAGAFNSPWVSAWRAASWYLDRVAPERRGQLMIDALRTTCALSVAAILIHLNDPADRNEEERDDFEPKIDGETLQALKDEWLQLVRKLAANGRALLQRPDLANLLFRWIEYGGNVDEPRAWVGDVTKTDEGFCTFVTHMMGSGTSQGWSDRVSSRFYRFERQTIEDFIGLDEAQRRLDAIGDNAPTAEAAHALGVLRDHLEEWSGGTPARRKRPR